MPRPLKLPQKTELGAQIDRSICMIRKKDMPEHWPSLVSTDKEKIILWAKEIFAQTVFEKSKDKDVPAFFQRTAAVIKRIGTHGFKLPNADVDTPPVFAQIDKQSKNPIGILCDGMLPETLTYSGGAGDMPLAKLLLAKITLDGIQTNVINELIEGIKSPITAALIECGMPEAACNMASEFPTRRSQQDLTKIPIHPLTKQIYFEEEGQEDVILIPVAPESLIAELHNQAQQPGRWLALRTLCAIGSTKPQNSGSLCNDMRGAFQLLQAIPPQFTDQSLQSRVARGGQIYTKYSVSSTDVLTFIHTVGIKQTTGNKNQRNTERTAYQWFAQTMLGALLETDTLVAETSMQIKKESDGIAAYLKRNREEEVGPELARDAANDVFDIVIKNNPNLRQHIADTQIRTMLIQQMIEVLL